MSKHTPGPWTHDETWGLILSRDGSEVAACHAGRSGSKAETQANARLIATAPDLFELVRTFAIQDGHLIDSCPCCMCILIQKVEARS